MERRNVPTYCNFKSTKLFNHRSIWPDDNRSVHSYPGGGIPTSLSVANGQQNPEDKDGSTAEGQSDKKEIKPQRNTNNEMTMKEAHENATKVSDQVSIA